MNTLWDGPRVRDPRAATPARCRRSFTRQAITFVALVLTFVHATGFLSLARAQRPFNFLAVDGSLVDDAGPFYFIDEGDSSNAFVKAAPFARAIDATVTFVGSSDLLTFDRGGVRVEVDVARDARSGLIPTPGVVRADGRPLARAVPRAILVDGTSYVPVTPLVEAFGGTVEWFPGPLLVDVSMPAVVTVDVATEANAGPVDSWSTVSAARVGRHDAFVRVAVDVPDGVRQRVLIAPRSVTVVFDAAAIAPFDVAGEGPLVRAYAATFDGAAALVLETAHDVHADGRGFRVGRTDAGVVYVDVGESLVGSAAVAIDAAPSSPSTPADVAAGVTPVVATPPAGSAPPVVVLDAGHGGHDPGTVSPWAYEKEIVLDVTVRLATLLTEAGIDVILTRDADEFLTLQERSTFATTERNVFVSIHANAEPNGKATGVETWVFGRPLDPSQIDRAIRENGGGEEGAARTAEAAESADILGEILREQQLNYSLALANAVQRSLVEATEAPDRGVRQNLFYVIRNSRIPAILVELGFVSHPVEGRKLMDPAYRADLAQALADGIVTFLESGGDVDVASR